VEKKKNAEKNKNELVIEKNMKNKGGNLN